MICFQEVKMMLVSKLALSHTFQCLSLSLLQKKFSVLREADLLRKTSYNCTTLLCQYVIELPRKQRQTGSSLAFHLGRALSVDYQLYANTCPFKHLATSCR